jgi:Tol biopolymer transport system component
VSILNGVQPDFGVSQIALSGDGKVMAYTTDTDLAVADQNGTDDVYVKTLATGVTTRATRPKGADPTLGGGTDPSLSSDGRYVAFSGGNDIDGVADPNPGTKVFVRDNAAGTVVRVSTTDAGAPSGGSASDPFLSANGRRVAYRSTGSPVTDTNGTVADVFVKDLDRNRTRVISTDWLLNQRPVDAESGSISADGHYAAFTSLGHFSDDDTNNVIDAYVRAVDVPGITSFTPTSAARGSTVTFTVTGTGFLPGASGVTLGGLFTTAGSTYTSDTRITVTLTIDPNAPTGLTDFFVANPGTGPGLTTGALARCQNCLKIT